MEAGIHEVADGCFAYLQLPGTWGYSNSGLVLNGGQALVVDTLYDPHLAGELRDAYTRVAAGAPLSRVVNTHANGDHCWGNQVFDDAEIISSRAAAEEMAKLPPGLMNLLMQAAKTCARVGAPARVLLAALGRLGVPRAAALAVASEFAVAAFGPFDFANVSLRLPDRTFDGALSLSVGDREVELLEVGPAHTAGDAIVYVPAAGVVFTGDILFEEAHPVIWEGPIENWIDACARIEAMEVDTVVPGHGRLASLESIRALRTYLVELRRAAREAYDAGVSAHDAAMSLRDTLMPDWGERERLAANVVTLYRQFAGDTDEVDPVEMLAHIARLLP